jgi:Holliday junction resolvase RusA-like endonuclease
MPVVVPRTWIPGIPRGWGNKKSETAWLEDLRRTLKPYCDIGLSQASVDTRYRIALEFFIWPESPKYQRKNLPHGTDLDNLVKNTLDCLTPHRQGGLAILHEDRALYELNAVKRIVSSDAEMGVWLAVESI